MYKSVTWRLCVTLIVGLLAVFLFYPLKRTLIVDRTVYVDFSRARQVDMVEDKDKPAYRHPLAFMFFRTETEYEYWCPKCNKYYPTTVLAPGKCSTCGEQIAKSEKGVDRIQAHEKVYVRGTITPGARSQRRFGASLLCCSRYLPHREHERGRRRQQDC